MESKLWSGIEMDMKTQTVVVIKFMGKKVNAVICIVGEEV